MASWAPPVRLRWGRVGMPWGGPMESMLLVTRICGYCRCDLGRLLHFWCWLSCCTSVLLRLCSPAPLFRCTSTSMPKLICCPAAKVDVLPRCQKLVRCLLYSTQGMTRGPASRVCCQRPGGGATDRAADRSLAEARCQRVAGALHDVHQAAAAGVFPVARSSSSEQVLPMPGQPFGGGAAGVHDREQPWELRRALCRDAFSKRCKVMVACHGHVWVVETCHGPKDQLCQLFNQRCHRGWVLDRRHDASDGVQCLADKLQVDQVCIRRVDDSGQVLQHVGSVRKETSRRHFCNPPHTADCDSVHVVFIHLAHLDQALHEWRDVLSNVCWRHLRVQAIFYRVCSSNHHLC